MSERPLLDQIDALREEEKRLRAEVEKLTAQRDEATDAFFNAARDDEWARAVRAKSDRLEVENARLRAALLGTEPSVKAYVDHVHDTYCGDDFPGPAEVLWEVAKALGIEEGK